MRPAAERLVEVRARMRELEREQGRHVTTIGGNGAGYAATDLNAAQAELHRLAGEAVECVERLEQIGVVLKDLDAGLLDFPARREGVDVLLCWHPGEEAVEWWHGPDEGYAGRKRVDWSE